MRKFAIAAVALLLSCAALGGCRAGNTDMTSTPTAQTTEATKPSNTAPSQNGARNRGNDRFRGENSHNRIDPMDNL